MRKIRCNECGNENEVPDEGDLPRCEACDQSLSTGTWLDEEADETDLQPVPDNPDEPQSPCTCEGSGGPMPGDPTTCFQCGGALPEPTSTPTDVPDDVEAESPAAPDDTDSESPPSPEPAPKAISCSLLLADRRRIPVAEGILVARGDPASGASPRIVQVPTPTVSRKHAWLGVRGQNLVLVDLGSTNGTYIDGRRIEPLRPEEIEPTGSVQISFGRNLRATLTFD